MCLIGADASVSVEPGATSSLNVMRTAVAAATVTTLAARLSCGLVALFGLGVLYTYGSWSGVSYLCVEVMVISGLTMQKDYRSFFLILMITSAVPKSFASY